MSQWGQALLAFGFIGLIFMAGYGARAALSRLRRHRGMFGPRHGRLIYAGRRMTVAERTELELPALPATHDSERLATDLGRLGEYVDELRSLFNDQRAMCDAARNDLATAAERFRASVEQTRALTTSLNDRLDAAQRLQLDFEQMISRLRKRGKDGDEAVLPFKVRQRQLSERKS